MEEFTRPFTEEEFDKAFRESGYPEIARRYCHDMMLERFNSLMRYEISLMDLNDLSSSLNELKKECS